MARRSARSCSSLPSLCLVDSISTAISDVSVLCLRLCSLFVKFCIESFFFFSCDCPRLWHVCLTLCLKSSHSCTSQMFLTNCPMSELAFLVSSNLMFILHCGAVFLVLSRLSSIRMLWSDSNPGPSNLTREQAQSCESGAKI